MRGRAFPSGPHSRKKTGANLVLIGLPGAGKSTVGRALAELVGAPFIELDELIEKRCNATIPDIFKNQGEEGFRDAETRILKKLKPPEASVVSAGGGVVEREENRALLRRLGAVVWLRIDGPVAAARCDFSTRPLLACSEDPAGKVNELAERRNPLYAVMSDYEVEAAQPLEKVVHELQSIWDSH